MKQNATTGNRQGILAFFSQCWRGCKQHNTYRLLILIMAIFVAVLLLRKFLPTSKEPLPGEALNSYDSQKKRLRSLAIQPPNAEQLGNQALTFAEIALLLAESETKVLSSKQGIVTEPAVLPDWPPLTAEEKESIGYGQSKFLATNRWATIRYLGDSPAGAGLNGSQLNDAQRLALGLENDSVPVVTTASTIEKMMTEFFVPLLEAYPGGQKILKQIHVQGAYYSPSYALANNIGFDNAFVIGLQLLKIFPAGCFRDSVQLKSQCSPTQFSTGHDPTIIAHELSHVIFNHLREKKTLEGFQWFALNEGYADYFSAAYFQDPFIGRIWRSNNQDTPFLRKLMDLPKISDPKMISEVHKYSTVWSSTLWRLKSRLVDDFRMPAADFNGIVLASIALLGETQGTKMGDAANALLKAAELKGYIQWKEFIRREIRAAEIDMSRENFTEAQRTTADEGNAASFDNSEEKNSQNVGCGLIVTKSKTAHSSYFSLLCLGLIFLPLIIPLFKRFKISKVKLFSFIYQFKQFKKYISLIPCFFLIGCDFFRTTPSPKVKRPAGFELKYRCFLEVLDSAKQGDLKINLLWYQPVNPKTFVQNILISDDLYENSPFAALLIMDKTTRKIEQTRTLGGEPLEVSLTERTIPKTMAETLLRIKLATLIFEASLVYKPQENQPNTQPKAGGDQKTVSFQFDGAVFTPSFAQNKVGGFGFGPMPDAIQLKDKEGQQSQRKVCEVIN